MTGTISLTTTGLILAETWETSLAAWTSSRVGSTTAQAILSSEAAHSGSKSVDFQTGADWPNAAYLKLTQSVDLKTGANRKVRFFRGLYNVKGGMFDDFLGSYLNQFGSRWQGSVGGVANSEAKLGDSASSYDIATSLQWNAAEGNVMLLAARLRVGANGKNHIFPNSNGLGQCGGPRIEWGEPYNGDYNNHFVDASNNLLGTLAYPNTAYHLYEYYWYHAALPSAVIAANRDGVSLGSGTGWSGLPGAGYAEFAADSWGKTDFYIDWLAVSTGSAYKCSLILGSQTMFDIDPASDYLATGPQFKDQTGGWVAVTPTGTQTIEIKVRNACGYKQDLPVHMFFDDLAIMLDTNMTFKGLLGGQKVELYDSGGVLRKYDTCPGTGIDVVFTGIDLLITTAYGFQSYIKVYDTDGTTLLYTSPTTSRWGGDVYTWLPNESAMDIRTTYTRIYKAGSGKTPTSCLVTVTLKDKETSALLADKAITWVATLGTVDPSSNSTDENGEASTTFTAGTNPGPAAVQAAFAGDATYGSCSIIQRIDIYETEPVPDATKDFQVFIEGQDVPFMVPGNYKLSMDFAPQSFSVAVPFDPDDPVAVGGWWLIEFYRWGVREFVGRILTAEYKGGTSPQLIITGVDDTITVQRRVANKGYTDEPKNIIADLLSRYPCGISAGTLSTFGGNINLTATYENLYDALLQIAKDTGWKFRRNSSNDTIDFASDFGQDLSATIVVEKPPSGSHKYDWMNLDSKVYVIGQGAGATLVSSPSNAGTEFNFGLIEDAFLEKGISVQGTLDLRAAEILNEHKVVTETISVDWIDNLPTATYVPFDTITVTDATTQLSGEYRIASMKRSLSDARMVTLELTNRAVTLADALQVVRKDVKDLGVM